MLRVFFFAALLAFICGCPRKENDVSSTVSTNTKTTNRLQINTSSGVATFEVEIARTPVERSQGLMRRESLDQDKGMLFIFDKDSNHAFWMKNTYIPLDLIFFDKNWITVGVQENLEPLSTKSRFIGTASRYVLEINAGLIKKLGIVKGSPALLVEKERI